MESSRPGEPLCADTFFAGFLKGIGKVYLHSTIGTYSSYAFGFLHTRKKQECAATLLHNDMLPFTRNTDCVCMQSSRITVLNSAKL